ncbi:MAG: 2TM domain-containing protein [Flavobacteriaceae bacterium]|nr:2TM domain-containing protein [Flavobacteriaceae bacterium]
MKNYEYEEKYIRAKKRVESIKGFHGHLTAYIIVNAFLLIFFYNVFEGKEEFWGIQGFSTVIFWGIGLAIHAFCVFAPDFFFGKKWEQKQIEKFMNEEKF